MQAVSFLLATTYQEPGTLATHNIAHISLLQWHCLYDGYIMKLYPSTAGACSWTLVYTIGKDIKYTNPKSRTISVLFTSMCVGCEFSWIK